MKLTRKIWCALIAGGLALVLLGAGIATVFQASTSPTAPEPPAAPAASPAPESPAAPVAPPAPESPAAPPAPESSAAPAAPPAPESPAAPAGDGDIGLDGAQAIALERAGLSSGQVTWTDTSRDWEHGRLEYELEFWVGQVEYDYDIDGATGGILQEKWEDHSAAGTTGDVGEAAAKAAALGHLGISENQTSALKVERELEKGLVEYEVKFWIGQSEYEYTVTGAGTIIEYKLENH